MPTYLHSRLCYVSPEVDLVPDMIANLPSRHRLAHKASVLGKAPDANGYTSSSRKKGGPRLWPLSVLNSCSSRASSNNSKDGMSKATYDDNLTDFDFSYKSRNRDDEHSCNAQIRGGDNSGENGRSPSSDERYRNGKNGTSVTVEQQLPIDGIYKTYEFSAVVEKGAVFLMDTVIAMLLSGLFFLSL